MEEDAGRLSRMRDSFEALLRAQVGGVTVHSGGTERIPNTSNLAFDGCTAEALMLLLEPAGLLCSAGSACHTLQPMPSHVLTAMGLSDEAVRSSLRFSLSFMTTQEEVEQAAALVGSAVRKVRGVQSSRTGPVLVYRPESRLCSMTPELSNSGSLPINAFTDVYEAILLRQKYIADFLLIREST